MFKKASGTKDILPEQAGCWQAIEKLARNIFSLYNYQEIRTPVIEEAGLFDRSLGEFAEIVQKQMFLIQGKDELYALRPEGTACIVRAYLENNLDKAQRCAKFYYLGPMFRKERPQKGRLRQFHHIGSEVIGSTLPEVDVELICLANALLDAYQVSGYEIKINNLGCAKDKKVLIKTLQEKLKGNFNSLCAECKVRFKQNTLRILDCKVESCRQTVQNLKLDDTHLCVDCKEHFSQVEQGLQLLGVKYEVAPFLVRGLDYYTRTVFEIKHPELGAQDAICAGGRYDNLVAELGGQPSGAVGFAFGVERLLLVSQLSVPAEKKDLVYVITLGEAAKKQGLKILAGLRRAGVPADTDYMARSLKGAMRQAGDLNAGRVLIIGENELQKGTVMLKDMDSGEQREVKADNLIAQLLPK